MPTDTKNTKPIMDSTLLNQETSSNTPMDDPVTSLHSNKRNVQETELVPEPAPEPTYRNNLSSSANNHANNKTDGMQNYQRILHAQNNRYSHPFVSSKAESIKRNYHSNTYRITNTSTQQP